jgi:hypothetical protein
MVRSKYMSDVSAPKGLGAAASTPIGFRALPSQVNDKQAYIRTLWPTEPVARRVGAVTNDVGALDTVFCREVCSRGEPGFWRC